VDLEGALPTFDNLRFPALLTQEGAGELAVLALRGGFSGAGTSSVNIDDYFFGLRP
jgi:hypothetical protein